MDIKDIQSVYFIGIGGIGMSAIARYFLTQGKLVAGYDRTATSLTSRLVEEGAVILYEDNPALIPEEFRRKETTLVVYTPAIPSDHRQLCWFLTRGFCVEKRAQVLGIITRSSKALCVAGTHGKTTTSTMLAHLLHQSDVDCNAFLGGISKNYGTNYILSPASEYVVIEADEFDRSFHHLSPYISVITSADSDHLDIYGTREAYLESFRHYTSLIRPGGVLIMHEGLEVVPDLAEGVALYTYSRDEGDFHAANVRIGKGEIIFDYVSPLGCIDDVHLGVPVSINIDNGIAAMAIAQLVGMSMEEIRLAMASFSGVERRFDFKYKSNTRAFICDYAHHPSEIRQSALSIRQLYVGSRITAIFQPHLYSRTGDFYREFAESLSLFDDLILTDIYPAREQPIPGVTSQLIADHLRQGMSCRLCCKEELSDIVRKRTDIEVLVMLGAGDVENYAEEIVGIMEEKDEKVKE
ncbi:MAG: UDP-N-acetylmuramate--L-alanine ligase [Bacteroidaceae bacterium]|nr:UDP-N-acetylmuramate--L-alanine ligase [Bacteroidaceae bacterium]MBQ8362261.1 UDP-N-acetylmuramate--L-alanine ligase [Bacteroidaceae bacterium]